MYTGAKTVIRTVYGNSKGFEVKVGMHQVETVRWCGRRLLDGHAGSAIKVLVAIHYSVLDARNGYIRNVVV